MRVQGSKLANTVRSSLLALLPGLEELEAWLGGGGGGELIPDNIGRKSPRRGGGAHASSKERAGLAASVAAAAASMVQKHKTDRQARPVGSTPAPAALEAAPGLARQGRRSQS